MKKVMDTIHILVIEDNPGDARLIKEYLKSDTTVNFSACFTTTLAESLETLVHKKFDVVLVDLGLPDSQGIYTFHEIINANPISPVVIITGNEDEKIGIEAVRHGAQNYLSKNQINSSLLVRTIKYAIEIKRINIELKENQEKYQALFEGAASLILKVDAKGILINCNERINDFLDYTKDETLGQSVLKLFHKESHPEVKKLLNNIFKDGYIRKSEHEMVRKDDEVISVCIHSSGIKDKSRKIVTASFIIDDITDRKQQEKEQKLTTKILTILNRKNEWSKLIKDILVAIREFTEIEAIAIRHKKGDYYPYVEAINYPDSFIKNANYLCSINEKGEKLYGSDGKPILECMCGKVISKRTDSSFDFFTEDGSFWTNSISLLLKTMTDEQSQLITRNYCRIAGFESVALIPLLSENETVGLLQLCDKRSNRFNKKMIIFLEGIGSTIGIAFRRMSAESLIIESEVRYRRLFESAKDGILIIDASTGQVIDINPFLVELLGYEPKELLGKELWKIGVFKDIVTSRDAFIKLHKKEFIRLVDISLETREGEHIDVELTCNSYHVKPFEVIQYNIRDITQRKLIEAALMEEQRLFNSLIENIPDFVYFKDIDSRFIRINKMMAEKFGLNNMEEALGKTDFDFYDEEHARLAFEDEQRIIRTGEPIVSLEEKEIWPDGRITWVSTTKMPQLDSDGKIKGIMGLSRDITERKKAEERIRFLSSVVEQSSDGMAIADLAGNLIFVNDSWAGMHGYKKRDELEGKNLSIFHNEEQINNDVEPFNREVMKKGFNKGEVRHIRKDGTVFPTQMTTTLLKDENNNPIAIAGVAIDITERKKAEEALKTSEEKFKTIFNSASDGMFLLDTETHKFIMCNAACSNMLGYTNNEFLQLDITELHPSEEFPFYEQISILMQGGEELYRKIKFKRKNDGIFTVELSPTLITIANKKVLLIVFRDITERLKIEEELIKAKMEAEESNRLKTAFLQNISHEIRTPMNAIVGFSEFLNNPGLLPEKREEFTDIIIQSSHQLLSIITDIIDIATIEAGQEKLNESDINLNLMCSLLYEQFLKKAQLKNISLDFKTTLENDEAIITTDETKLTQVLSNLINNAVKFTTSGHVYFGYQKKENDLEFYVEDTGLGISPDLHEKIFERFYQIDGSSTRKYGGSGLGLSISKAYVGLLGGHIWLTSEPGKGSVFHFNIPYKKTIPAASSTEQFTDFESLKVLGLKTILIAEDEVFNFMYLEELFSETDFTVLHARNGKEAVEIYKSNRHIDLVLMDIKMPVMDGYEATRQIKGLRNDLPVLALTAYFRDSDKSRALECGCSDFISKPVNKNELIMRIKRLLVTDISYSDTR
jgi:PAS domain S-box-containing protein